MLLMLQPWLLLLALLELCCRRESWSTYNTFKMWQTLLATTRQESHDHSVLADVYGNIVVNKLADLMDDMQRVHKKVSYWPHFLWESSLLLNSNGSRVAGFFVFPDDTSKTDAAWITRLDTQTFHDKYWKPIYFGVKRSSVNVTDIKQHCCCCCCADVGFSRFIALPYKQCWQHWVFPASLSCVSGCCWTLG